MRKMLAIIAFMLFSLTVVIFSAENDSDENPINIQNSMANQPGYTPNIRGDEQIIINKSESYVPKSLGFTPSRATSPGYQIGTTTYDLQTNATMPRLVEWSGGGNYIDFAWTHQLITALSQRYVRFYSWNKSSNSVVIDKNMNPASNLAGYASLDVTGNDRAMLSFNYNGPEGWLPDIYGQSSSGTDTWGSHLFTLSQTGGEFFTWPRIEFQDAQAPTYPDDIIHVVSQVFSTGELFYTRHVGSTVNSTWDANVAIDTIPTTGYIVTASRVSPDVAIVWAAPPGYPAGSNESDFRGGGDPQLGVNQRINDIYYQISNDMGSTWNPKVNLTAYDSTLGGYFNHGDLSALYDSNGDLHIVWNGRPVVPYNPPTYDALGAWANPDVAGIVGGTQAKIFHWCDATGTISEVTDAEWDQTTCYGYDWNELNVNKPVISECNNKFYITWIQFNDVPFGISEDCHNDALTFSNGYSDANGEIYLSISDDDGLTWGGRQNLTNSYSHGCTDGNCESDSWASLARFGDNYAYIPPAPIVDPSNSYTGSYYLDVMYINDKSPGPYFNHTQTTNPVNWFRLACGDPLANQTTVSTYGDGEYKITNLRAAITYANFNPGPDTIEFAGSGARGGTIALMNPLPPITDDSTTIISDGSVILDGSVYSVIGDCLEIQSSHNHIEGLVITGFSGNGISVTGAGAIENEFTNNLIYDNGGLAIDLGDDGVTYNDAGDADSGPNELLNFPEITSITTNLDDSFTLDGNAGDTGIVEFYLSDEATNPARIADPTGHGEAYEFLGADTADHNGDFTFDFGPEYGFDFISMIAIDTFGNTSEFSSNFSTILHPLIIVGYAAAPGIINMTVVDPDGLYIGKSSDGTLLQNLFPATYVEVESRDSITIDYPKEGLYTIVVYAEDAPPKIRANAYSIGIRIDGTEEAVYTVNGEVPPPGESDTYQYYVEYNWHYINGDANRDGTVNILDIIYVINCKYKGGPCPFPWRAGECDCNGDLNILDIVCLINYKYKGGPEPCLIE